MESVLSAEVTNAIGSVTYQWQYDLGSGWVDWSSFTSNVKTHVWGTTFDARARSVDANNVTSEWSSSATLTVHPSDISATLSFTPSNLLRGASTVLAAVGTNGTAPYIYNYEWRYNTNQSWTASGTHASGITNVWVSNITFRVQAVDSFSSTSAWTEASLTVVQPSVSVSFSPSTITQSMESVLSAEVTNATGSVTYQWQYDLGSGWVDWSSFTSNVKTYVWGTTFDARARSVDANNVTSEWSSSATLTVHPSDISATLSFTPSNLLRGASTVLAAVGTNGTAPYIYNYEWRYNTNQSWTASGTHASGITNVWVSNITFRVQAVDSFSSTSAWTEASLTVVQPSVLLTFNPTQVVYGVSSVLSAAVTNMSSPYSLEFQTRATGETVWASSTITNAVTTNEWLNGVEYRARATDTNNLTTVWSSVATLIVTPPTITVSLAVNTNEVEFGGEAVLTSTPANGTGPYTFEYQSKDTTVPGNSWETISGLTAAIETNNWFNDVDVRVRVRDTSNDNLSYWSSSISITVVAASASDSDGSGGGVLDSYIEISGIMFGSTDNVMQEKSRSSSPENRAPVTVEWVGSAGHLYSVLYSESLFSGWVVHPDGENIQSIDGPMSITVEVDNNINSMFFMIQESVTSEE